MTNAKLLLLGALITAFAVLTPANAALQPDEDATAHDFLPFTHTTSGGTMPYRLFVPDGYDPGDVGAKYPLVVFLHGLGEQGTNNLSQLSLTSPLVFLTAKSRERHPCFMVAPQTSGSTWSSTTRQGQLNGIINHLLSQYQIDTDRLYITGISLGGNGTWTQASQNPERYAAVVPVCGWGPRTGLTHVPLWNFHAVDDNVVSIGQTNGSDPNIAAIRAAGGNPIYTRYDTGYHNIWDRAYSTPGLVEWVMAQRKGQRPAAGPAMRIQTAVRGASLSLTGAVAGGVESHASPVTQVAWTNLATSSAGTATGTSEWMASGVTLAAGENQVRVTATAGTWSTWGGSTTFSETVSVTHAVPTGDTLPPSLAIVSPTTHEWWTTSGSTLGIGGTVSDNTGVVTLLWSNDRGGSGSILVAGSWAAESVPLEPGANVLTVTATDAAGNFSRSVLRVWSGPGGDHLVTAGAYQIVAHDAAASLAAFVWQDHLPPDAEVSLEWTKLSGPGAVNFSSPEAASTAAGFGQPGTYVLAVSASHGEWTDVARTVVVVRPDPSAGSTAAAIHCGGTSDYLASDGITYVADIHYTNGESAATWGDVTAPLSGTSDPALYRRFRQSASWQPSFTYAIPVANGAYDLTLKFLDGTSTFISQRRFDLIMEGVEVASNIDICKLVGKQVAMDLVFPVTVDDGELNIAFNRDIGGSVLSAIQVRSSSGSSVNMAPLVDAGEDGNVTMPGTVTLEGVVVDDGLAPGEPVPTIGWSKVSGPGTVSFAQPQQAATSATFSEPGSYELRLTASDGVYSTTDDVTVTVTAAPAATGWAHMDIGAVAEPGDMQHDDGIFTVQGSGSSIGGAEDQMHFAYQEAEGDCSIIARVTSFEGGHPWYARFGVMIRESLGGSGRYVAMTLVPGGTWMSWRSEPSAGWSNGVAGGAPATPPLWVKITRVGNVFTGYKSTDGAAWILVSSVTLDMGPECYLGMAVTAWDNTAGLATATFDNVMTTGTVSPEPVNTAPSVSAGEDLTVTMPEAATLDGVVLDDGLAPGDPAPAIGWSPVSGPGTVNFTQPQQAATTATFSEPGIYVLRLTASDGVYTTTDDMTVTVLPAEVPISGWAHMDIGAVAVPGDMQQDDGTFTVQGSGSSIGAAEDQMHFAYQEAEGDCSITARVTSFEGGHPWYARFGVMIRESLGGSGRYVAMTLVPGGTWMSWRSAPSAGWSNGVAGGAPATPPLWVKITRVGNVFTGYKSTDGAAWILVSSVTLDMGPECYLGMAVTAWDNTAGLATATFDNVGATGVTVPDTGPWLGADVGPTGAAGSFTYDATGGAITINGAGQQIWGNDQQFHYVYQTMSGNGSGDGSIIARITSHSTAHWAGLSGIMIRDSLDPEANCIFVGRDAGGAIKWHYHGYNQSWGNGTTISPGPAAPVWLKLSREGNTFTGFYSTDGTAWTLAGTVDMSVPAETLVGMFTFSGVTGTLGSTVFDNATTTGTSPLLPGWSSIDLGNVNPPGHSYMTIDGTATIHGSGVGFAGNSDSGHFTYKELTGDGQIAMRVAGMDGGPNSAAQVGLMIRDSLSSDSRNAIITLSPDQNLRFQAHLNAGDPTSVTTTTPGVDLPYWIKLARVGNVITGFYSQDGWNWLPAGSATIALSSDAYIGVAASSKTSGVLMTASIDRLTQGEVSNLPPASVPVMTDITSGLTLIDEIDTATVAPHYVSGASTHSVETILGESARVMSNSSDTAATIAYVVGSNKGLVPGRSYVLEVEYPEDAARSMYITNRGADYLRGVATGVAGGDARQQYTEPTIESLNYPLSGTWKTHRQFFTLMDRFQGVVGKRDSEDGWRPYGPADGFHVAFSRLKNLDDPRSEGVAIGCIRLYEVTDHAALYAPIHYPPPNLPRRSTFWREEMGDGVIHQRTNPDDNAFTDTLDWFQDKMRMAKVLGINTFSKDLLEFGYNQGFETGDSTWMMETGAPNNNLWTRLVPLATDEGLDLMPYFEYKGSLGITNESLGQQKRAQKLYHGINTTGGDTSNYNSVWWTYNSNADLTEADTLADVKRIMDRVVGDFKTEGRFRGVWFRTRGHHLPMSFSPNAIAKFNIATSSSATQATLIDSYEGDTTQYDQYVNWWFGERRDFLLAIRDYLRNTHGQAGIDVLFTPWRGEAVPVPHPFEQPFGYTGVVTDDTAWWTTFKDGLTDLWWHYHWRPTSFSSMEPLYDVALTNEPPISLSWDLVESFHDTPYADTVNYESLDNVYMTYPFGRLFTVESEAPLDSFRTNSGLTMVKHYALNEDSASEDGPFAGQLGYLSTDCDRAGDHLMLQQARAVANGDPRNIGYLAASSFSSWSPEVMRRFNQAFLAVPAIPSVKLTGASSDTAVVVRQYTTSGQGTYYYVVNTSMEQKTVTVTLPGSGTVKNLVTLANESGTTLNLTLDSAELRAYRVGP